MSQELRYLKTYGFTRKSRAFNMINRDNVLIKQMRRNVFFVQSQRRPNTFYKVIYPNRCNCPDYQQRIQNNPIKSFCKHMHAVKMMLQG